MGSNPSSGGGGSTDGDGAECCRSRGGPAHCGGSGRSAPVTGHFDLGSDSCNPSYGADEPQATRSNQWAPANLTGGQAATIALHGKKEAEPARQSGLSALDWSRDAVRPTCGESNVWWQSVRKGWREGKAHQFRYRGDARRSRPSAQRADDAVQSGALYLAAPKLRHRDQTIEDCKDRASRAKRGAAGHPRLQRSPT